MAKRHRSMTRDEATFALDEFVGIAGHDMAERIQQQAHMSAGGNNVRRAQPDLYDISYYESLVGQIWPMKKNPEFWDKVQERYNQEMERPGGYDRSGDFNLQLRAAREALGVGKGTLGKLLEERRQNPEIDTPRPKPSLRGEGRPSPGEAAPETPEQDSRKGAYHLDKDETGAFLFSIKNLNPETRLGPTILSQADGPFNAAASVLPGQDLDIALKPAIYKAVTLDI